MDMVERTRAAKRHEMSILIVLIIVSLLVAGGFLAAFLWAVRSGQYDDPHSPSVRILQDDKPSHSMKENR